MKTTVITCSVLCSLIVLFHCHHCHRLQAQDDKETTPLQKQSGAEDSTRDKKHGNSLNFTPLHQAASSGDVEKVKELLAAKADVNAKCFTGGTPLHYAAGANGSATIPLLLAAGADINAKNNNGHTPLFMALWTVPGPQNLPALMKGKPDVNAADNEGFTPLMFVCASDNFLKNRKDIAKQLIEAGADVNKRDNTQTTALHWACIKYPDLVDVLINAKAKLDVQDDKGVTPVHYAVLWDRFDAVMSFVKAKANLNIRDKQNRTPLLIAADQGNVEMLALLQVGNAREPSWTALHRAILIDGSENIEALVKNKSLLNKADAVGRTPLYWALNIGDKNNAELLIKNGADLTVVDKHGQSLLHIAAYMECPKIVELILAAGVDVNCLTDKTETPLFWAVSAESFDSIRLLLKNKADINAATTSGETAIMRAVPTRNHELIKLLLDSGADVLAYDNEGHTIADLYWQIFDKNTVDMLKQKVVEQEEDRIARVCQRYSPNNPQAPKSGDLVPTTPQLAAKKMYRLLFETDKPAFMAMFVGQKSGLAVIEALYDATHEYIAFRKEMTDTFGADAWKQYSQVKLDSEDDVWFFTLNFVDEDNFNKMPVTIKKNLAMCPLFPGFHSCGNVYFLKKGDRWYINPSFLVPPAYPEKNIVFTKNVVASIQAGRTVLGQPGKTIKDVKEIMSRFPGIDK